MGTAGDREDSTLEPVNGGAALNAEDGGEREGEKETTKGKAEGFALGVSPPTERSEGGSPPILEEKEYIPWRDDSAEIRARKCKCGSVWCPECSKDWAKRQAEELKTFNCRTTRMVTYTVDPSKFKNGKEAYDHITEHRLVAQSIKNMKRGKKKKIGKKWVTVFESIEVNQWRAYLEWHENGFPHYHVLIDVGKEGAAGMIGNERIRHYWPIADWVHEDHFESEEHWKNMVGYFEKNGYFNKGKKHQTTLPEWALKERGLKIRRSSGSVKHKNKRSPLEIVSDYFKRKTDEVVDTRTGEIINYEPVMKREERTYKERLSECGKRAKLAISMGAEVLEFIADIPYKEIRQGFPGEYKEGKGYFFRASREVIRELIAKCIKVVEYERKRTLYWQEELRGLIKWKWCLKIEPVVEPVLLKLA